MLAAIHELRTLSPIIGVVVRDGFDLDGLVWLLVGTAATQLAAGIAIATGARHARLFVVAWTLTALASAIFARDLMRGITAHGTITLFVETLAGPTLVWLAAVFAGEEPPLPQVPSARIASSTDIGESAMSAIDRATRRRDLGVALVGMGIVWIVAPILSRIVTFRTILAYAEPSAWLLLEVAFLGYAIVVGALAVRAGNRLVSASVSARAARRALGLFVLLDLTGTIVQYGLMIGYQLVVAELSTVGDRMVIAQFASGAVFALIIPMLVWWYASTALAESSEPPVASAPARLALVPAFAVTWCAPLLASRVFAIELVDANVLSRGVLGVISIVCVLQGIIHVVAAIALTRAWAATRAGKTDAAERSLSTARTAAIVGTVGASLMTLGWTAIALLADAAERRSLPTAPLVYLVGATAALWWGLARGRTLLSAKQ